jgi:hypothetical protein
MSSSENSRLPDAEIAAQPNKYAPASGFSQKDGVIRLDGYQAFEYEIATGATTPRTKGLKAKAGIIAKYFAPRYCHGRTVLDLGGNNGYYCFQALASGAVGAHVVDMDKAPIQNLGRFNAVCPHVPIKGTEGNVMEVKEPADVVIALALIHWIYSLTTGMGSLERAVGFLAGLAKEALIVEWVDAQDDVIVNFHHVSVEDQTGQNPYTREEFLRQLKARFSSVRCIGKVSATREIYLAAHPSFLNVDHRWQQPILSIPEHTHISTREIAPGVWSRLYAGHKTYHKQASLKEGKNELGILSKLEHAALPKVAFVREEGGSVVFSVEKMPGQNLAQLSQEQPLPLAQIEDITRQLAAVLAYLQSRGVMHRDVQPANVIYDPATQRLALIDFGWASGPGAENLTLPDALGSLEDFQGRAPGADPEDTYAFGCLLLWMLRGRAHPLAQVALWCLAGAAEAKAVAEVCAAPPEQILAAFLRHSQAVNAGLAALATLQTACAEVAEKNSLRCTWLPSADLALGEKAISRLTKRVDDLNRQIAKLEEDKVGLKKKIQKLMDRQNGSKAEKGKKRRFWQKWLGGA